MARRGNSLSPRLFSIIMDKIIDLTKDDSHGYRLGKKRISMVCYADDVALIDESEDNLQRQLQSFRRAAEIYNMEISVKKTKCLTISREPTRCKLIIDNQPIEQVMLFNYLGATISSFGNLTTEVRDQVTKANQISGCLRDIVWKNKNMTTKSKSRIYKTCIRPILTYTAETRPDTTKTKSALRTSEMRILRTICGKTLLDRIRNETIRTECETEDIVRWTRKRRRMWNEHINRMTDDRLVKIARNGKPETRRPPGRPPKRWRDSWQSTSQENG